MITYKDMTFCGSDCTNIKCPRHVTDEIIAAANEIGLPMAMADFSPDCREYIPDETEAEGWRRV